MTYTSVSKSTLVAIGVSLLAFGCSTAEQPELNTTSSANVPAASALPQSTAPEVVTPKPEPAAKVRTEVVTADGGIVVPEAPPETPLETPTMAPGPYLTWVPGGWVWQGRWIWARGHWQHPPNPGAVWVPAKYIEQNGQHIYIPGTWR